jgi:hypothetical protein
MRAIRPPSPQFAGRRTGSPPLSRHFAKPPDSFGVDAKMVRSGRTMIVTEANPYEIGLDKNAANYVPLTPMGFLLRSASIYPDRLAVAYRNSTEWQFSVTETRYLLSS